MQFNYIADGIDALVIDEFYTPQQMEEIWKELDWITKPSIFVDEYGLSTGVVNGEIQASKKGIWVDGIISHWKYSALISHPMKNLNDPEFKQKLFSYNPLYKILYSCDKRTHLLSYYENEDYYKTHVDATVFTVLNYFHKDPKQFSGGEIVLSSSTSDKKAVIESKNNRVVIIAGCTPHEVKPIISDLGNTYSGNGRYCNAIFFTVLDTKESIEQERFLK